jgi:nucleotide-binding universal stress UspA family protein
VAEITAEFTAMSERVPHGAEAEELRALATREGLAALAAEARALAEDTVREVLGPQPDVPIVTEVHQGHPAVVLVDAARGADLLGVGSRGHGAFTGMLLGSVSEYCVTHADCPVVVFRRGEQADEQQPGA